MSTKDLTPAPNQAAADRPPMAPGGMISGGAKRSAFRNVKFNTDIDSAADTDDAATSGKGTSRARTRKNDARVPKLIAGAGGEEAAQALRDARQELRRLSGLLLSIQEDERRRIALDLHDGLGQSISLIKVAIERSAELLDAGETSEAVQSLRRLIPRVEAALVEVRRVSTQLRPSILDDLGILPTLSWFFREFETACGGGIVVERAFNVAEHDVPASLRITLYRILQEAVHNIVKHAAADRVRVRLDRDDDSLHLVIEDNGQGFDPDRTKWVEGQTRGLGLISMKERASFSGGTLLLDSTPGKGTRIKVSWPVGACPASVDCCRTSGAVGTQAPCRALKGTECGDPKNTVHRV